MIRAFAIILVLVLASYGIGHNVVTVPLTRQYVGNTQVMENAAYSALDPSGSQLIQSVKDVDEEYAMNAPARYVFRKLFYANIKFAGGKDLLLLLDLTTPWLSVSFEGCQTCKAHTLLSKNEVYDCEEQQTSITYIPGVSTGKVCKTSVAAMNVPWYYAEGVKVLAVESTTLANADYTFADGILGLSLEASEETDLLVDVMKKQGLIDKSVFSVEYRDNVHPPEITFGGINTDKVPGLENLTFTNLYENNSWSVEVKVMKLGAHVFSDQPVKGILDTGGYLQLSSGIYQSLTNYMSNGRECRQYDNLYQCVCNDVDDLGHFYFEFGGFEYRINYNTMSWPSNINGKRYCNFLVQELKTSAPTVILGAPFLRNYYVYHDMEEKRVGLYGIYMHDKRPRLVSTSPSTTSESTKEEVEGFIASLNLKTSVLIVSLILNFITLCFLCVFCIRWRCKDEDDEKAEVFL